MKVVMVALALVVLTGGPAWAEAKDMSAEVKKESDSVFGTILHILLKWVFPVAAAYCFIYGVVARGVKRGEWDMAAICVLASVALALFPKLLEALFGVKLS